MQNKVYIKNLGEMKRHESIPSWLVAEDVSVPFFDNKKLDCIVDLGHEYDETNIDLQKVEVAVENFLKLDSSYRESISNLVYKNYRAVVDNCGIDEIGVKSESHVWDYVSPSMIYIKQESHFENRKYVGMDIFVTIDCKCAWEEEHGLQIVFRMGNKDIEVR